MGNKAIYMDEETIEAARLIAQDLTITQVADITGVPRSTIHYRLRTRLEHLDVCLASEVDRILVAHRKVDPSYLHGRRKRPSLMAGAKRRLQSALRNGDL